MHAADSKRRHAVSADARRVPCTPRPGSSLLPDMILLVARFKITLEYAGTRYSGWQKQKNARTVQGELESAIGAATREKTFEFMGSGRTDAGVHALRQIAHLDVRKPLPAETLRRSAFAKPFVWWVKDPLDLDRMEQAAARFTGMHDFQAFSDDDPDEKSTDVLVEDVTIAEDGDLILIRVGGSHFIWKMVRRMVGVLAEVGKGAIA